MKIYNEEIFGPVLSIVRVKNYEDALKLVNDHPFGNGTSIYTSDGEVSRNFTTNSKIGMVGVNVLYPFQWHFIVLELEAISWRLCYAWNRGINFYTKLKQSLLVKKYPIWSRVCNANKLKNIIITGCCGFIGYHTALKFLNDKKYKIIGIDNLNNYYDIKLNNLG